MAQHYEYVATSKIEIPPGSGIVAYAEGQGVPAEAVENLGVHDLVEKVGGSTSSRQHSSSHSSHPSASSSEQSS